jgi:hypothetical protein
VRCKVHRILQRRERDDAEYVIGNFKAQNFWLSARFILLTDLAADSRWHSVHNTIIRASMQNIFRVHLRSFSNIREIEGARTKDDYSALLEAMDYGDQSGMSDGELREMCIMSLQDLEPTEAAYLVLKHDMGGVLRDGQIRNAASEMLDEKLWEEFADSSLHERMFNAGSLLYEAFPQSFPEPDAVRVEIEVTATNAPARALLTPTPNESFLARLLADGMDNHAVLHRLYSEQLNGKLFLDADEVVWIVRTEAVSENVMNIEIISSGYWLDALDRTEHYESSAYADDIQPIRH